MKVDFFSKLLQHSHFSVRLIQKDLPKFVHIIYKPKDYGKENCHILYAYALCH